MSGQDVPLPAVRPRFRVPPAEQPDAPRPRKTIVPETRGRVALITAKYQNYERQIPQAIGEIGYEALWIDERVGNSFWAKMLTRLGLMQRLRPLVERHTDRIAAAAAAFGADKILLVSPETLRAREIARLRRKLPEARIILYVYDSSANRQLRQDMIDAADTAYSFDTVDCDAFERLHHVPLFHSHRIDKITFGTAAEPDFDFCFIGTARLRRIEVLSRVIRRLRADRARFHFYLFAPSLPQYLWFRLGAFWYGYGGTLSRARVPFETYVDTMQRSACVVDVEQANQQGLTIRTIDAVFAGRPLATSNPRVAEHDFFAHAPVSVFSPEDPVLEVPAIPPVERWRGFFDKYHIHAWLETILSEARPGYRIRPED